VESIVKDKVEAGGLEERQDPLETADDTHQSA
jgi:hypothetical protein